MRALVVVAALTWSAAVAHAGLDTVATYSTVDEYERIDVFHFSMTGIPVGQSAPQTALYGTPADFSNGGTGHSSVGDDCARAAMMMMNRPGRWNLQINSTSGGNTCRLIKQ